MTIAIVFHCLVQVVALGSCPLFIFIDFCLTGKVDDRRVCGLVCIGSGWLDAPALHSPIIYTHGFRILYSEQGCELHGPAFLCRHLVDYL